MNIFFCTLPCLMSDNTPPECARCRGYCEGNSASIMRCSRQAGCLGVFGNTQGFASKTIQYDLCGLDNSQSFVSLFQIVITVYHFVKRKKKSSKHVRSTHRNGAILLTNLSFSLRFQQEQHTSDYFYRTVFSLRLMFYFFKCS